ncbi:ParB N-terminal domain-containing protein [Candidatus Dependentiae bacterium]|nr:ParB N-terminal domain-containing protein [Candidatus Dependentiae bacterium]
MNEMFQIEERAIGEFGEKYAALRIVTPKADAAMERSLSVYGQLTPVVCTRSPSGYELIDGFKRLRASRQLKKATVMARIMETSERASKAAMIQLNKASRSLSAMEEAFVAYSLQREDGLNQVEIGVLLGRHKSWVCRRLALIEHLDAGVQQELRLGLISVMAGMEVARLQRCNQKEAVAAIHKHGLSTRETAKLVKHLLSRPHWEYAAILYSPWELFDDRAVRPKVMDLKGRLMAMHRICRSVSEQARSAPPEEISVQSATTKLAMASGSAAVADLKKALEIAHE